MSAAHCGAPQGHRDVLPCTAMDAFRTPDERFANLPDFGYAPHYVEVPSTPRSEDGGTLRMAYVDEGPRDAPVVLMLHGEPSWSFLYRKVIRGVVEAGLRAVAPDLIGFGRSDKPLRREDYTYQRHMDWLYAFLDATKLSSGPAINLLCQDWGGLLGLRLVGERPELFARVVASNTFLPTGDREPPPAFFSWREFSQTAPVFPTSRIIRSACVKNHSDEVFDAYDAPFPEESAKAGARQFPLLVPVSPDDPATAANRVAWAGLEAFDKPFLCAFGDSDPVTAGADRALIERIPGAKGRAHVTIPGAGHFVQEDAGDELGRIVADFVRST